MNQFVDYLSISQIRIPGSLPVVGREHRLNYDLHTGELVSSSVLPEQRQGSYDSSLNIKSDSSRLSLWGNPSGFDRPDNLFGLRCVAHAIDIVNPVVESLGLPGFDSLRANELARPELVYVDSTQSPTRHGYFSFSNGRQSQRTETVLADERARISRIDITENLSTNDAMAAIRHLSTYRHHGHMGHIYANGCTVEWGGKAFSGKGSRRIYHKYYIKSADIRDKIAKLKKRVNSSKRYIIEYHIDYLTRLANWCDEYQIVRRETSFKSTELIDRNLIFLEAWNIPIMNNIIRPYQFHNKLNIAETRIDSVFDFLLEFGSTPPVARKAELIHSAWVAGKDVSKLCGSKATFYRYRNLLLSVGVDIFNPCNISKLTFKEHRTTFKNIDPPQWYQQHSSNLRLVA